MRPIGGARVDRTPQLAESKSASDWDSDWRHMDEDCAYDDSTDFRDKKGRIILARACEKQDLAAVKFHLRKRPEHLNTADNEGNTPLRIAALTGSLYIGSCYWPTGVT